MKSAILFMLILAYLALHSKSEGPEATIPKSEAADATMAGPEKASIPENSEDKSAGDTLFTTSEKLEEDLQKKHDKTKRALNDMMLGRTRSIVGCFLLIDKLMTIRNKDSIAQVMERTKLNKTRVYQRIKIDLIRECEDKVNDDNLATVLLRSSDKYPNWDYLETFAKYKENFYNDDDNINLAFSGDDLRSVKHYEELLHDQKLNSGEIEQPIPREHIDVNVFENQDYNQYHKVLSLIFVVIMVSFVVYDFSVKSSQKSPKEKKKQKKK